MDYLTDLTVVGTGIAGPAHVSAQARVAIESSEAILALVADSLTRHWLWKLRPDAHDLSTEYAVGRLRMETYSSIVRRILESVRSGRRTCAVFYGHPGVFVYPSHAAIEQARAEGFSALMLPGVSAEDCLFADLGIDPGLRGCQSYEATVFLVRRREFDPTAGLMLWQAGAIGVADYREEALWNRAGLRLLTEVLLRRYPPEHPVVIYEASTLPIGGPKIERTTVEELADAPVTALSTIWVEPLPERAADEDVLLRLGLITG